MVNPRTPRGRDSDDDRFGDRDDGSLPPDAELPRRRRGPAQENPIRKIVSETLAQVDSAISGNFRQPVEIGFRQPGGEPVDVRELMTQLEAATSRLTMVEHGFAGVDILSSTYRTFAQGVKSALQEFRVFLIREARDGMLPESARLGFVEGGLEICKALSGMLHQFDSFQAQNGLSAAA